MGFQSKQYSHNADLEEEKNPPAKIKFATKTTNL
uniref:Uncharacterized protein n=1 Tax=Arundo donax TaxID=35708 RepID=A0A0A8Z375_ARUDO